MDASCDLMREMDLVMHLDTGRFGPSTGKFTCRNLRLTMPMFVYVSIQIMTACILPKNSQE
jgi:hypothetical protein